MNRTEAWDIFLNSLLDSASKIDKKYYRVKLAYFNQSIYREHVYCNELYHQLRKSLNEDFPYDLAGEVDKASHPDIVDRCLEFKSDFLIHKPGNVDSESFLAIMHIMSINSAFRYTEKLIEKFQKMVCATGLQDGYYRGIMLIYGDESAELDRGIYDLYKNYCRGAYDKVLLYYHRAAKEKPVQITIT